jgi:hypothetical protein
MAVDELSHPLPVVARAPQEMLLFFQVSARAKRPVAGACQDDNGQLVVPAGVFEGLIQL